MNKRFLLILVGIVLAFGAYFFFTNDNGEQTGNSQTAASNHVYGKADSKVTVVEYGDFECPACAAYVPIVQQIKANYEDKIAFQFRHFPLVQIHQNAMAASRAAEAASKQGKFWEMHDLLYGQQDAWAKSPNAASIFEDYATQLSLSIDQFKADMAAQSTLDTINADVREGQKLNVTGTPTFVINGQKVEQTPQTYEAFAALIDAALKEQGQ